MANSFKRTDRIAELIQRTIAQLIQQEIKDPRMPRFVTITGVNVTRDLAHAKVYFTVFKDELELTQSILNSAAGYLRSALAKSIQLRTIPQLHFVYDESIEYGNRLSRLIDEANPPESDESE